MKRETCCAIFGHKEADIERDDELEKILRQLLSKGITNFIFCEINKFTYQCFRILGKIKNDFKFVKRLYAFTNSPAIDKRIYKKMIFDDFYANRTVKVKTVYQIIDDCDYVLVQYFKTLHDKDAIIEYAYNNLKGVILF